MDLSRAADLLEVHICQARAPAMGAEPEVRIPVSMARVYLSAMRHAQGRLEGAEVVLWGEQRSQCNCPEAGTSGSCPFHDTHTDTSRFATTTRPA